jgi:hypothetical protein
MEDMKIIYSDCNSLLPNENDKCNKCGSTNKIINLYLRDKISMHEKICFKVKDKTNNRYYEHIETLNGKELHHCDEKLIDHQGHGNSKIKFNK